MNALNTYCVATVHAPRTRSVFKWCFCCCCCCCFALFACFIVDFKGGGWVGETLLSGTCYCAPLIKTIQGKSSFIPTSVKLLNKLHWVCWEFDRYMQESPIKRNCLIFFSFFVVVACLLACVALLCSHANRCMYVHIYNPIYMCVCACVRWRALEHALGWMWVGDQGRCI